MTSEVLSKLILERLQSESQQLRAEFHQLRAVPTRFVTIDNVLPDSLARQIFEAFPTVAQMRLLSTFREKKYTSKAMDKMDPLIGAATFAFQTPEVLRQVALITGLQDMVSDPHLYAGGISTMLQSHFLQPHIDNSHDSVQQCYRVLNLLYYVTPNWRSENGGNLELWDDQVRERVEVPSLFNRLVIMETHRHSWHSVNRVKTAGSRCCVSNYYFSPHPPEGREHFHITSFKARPEQPVQRALMQVDTVLRSTVRKIIKPGLGRSDVYEN